MPKLIQSNPNRPNITIEFTPEEQDLLLEVCNLIGGSVDGPRGVFSETPNSLGTLLENIGAENKGKVERGSIYFK